MTDKAPLNYCIILAFLPFLAAVIQLLSSDDVTRMVGVPIMVKSKQIGLILRRLPYFENRIVTDLVQTSDDQDGFFFIQLNLPRKQHEMNTNHHS